MLIVKMICLAIGTVLAVLFILLTMRGKKEDWRIEGVPEKEFSDKELWAAGFAMQQMPMFSMDSAVGKKMISASAILHPENGGRFVEYWARLYWARTLSMSLLVLALAFCAAVFMDGYMLFAVLVAGVAMVAVIYSNGANEMSNQLQKRSTECMMEFSNVVSKLTLLMNCGMILKEAWYIVAKSKQGIIYELMQEACREMDNGMASAEAIYNFGVRTGSPEVRKFASIIMVIRWQVCSRTERHLSGHRTVSGSLWIRAVHSRVAAMKKSSCRRMVRGWSAVCSSQKKTAYGISTRKAARSREHWMRMRSI